MDDAAHRAAVRHAAFDAFRHQLVGGGGVLEVAVLRPLLHGSQRTHAAVALVRTALVQLGLARRFLGTGQQAANHDGRGTGGQRLADVARVADATVGDQRDAVLQRFGHQVDGGDLRHADAGDDARGADRARADADLHCVRAAVQQRQCGFAGADVATDDLHVREVLLDPADAVQHALRVAVRGIHHDHVHAGGDQRFHAAIGIATHADGSADQQAGRQILGSVREVGVLLDVLDGDQATQFERIIDHQHLFDAVAVQQLQHFIRRGAFLDRDQAILLGHDVADRIVQLGLEAHVAVGHDAGQQAVAAHHRHAGDVVRLGQGQHIADGGFRADGDRVADDTGLELLDLGHFRGLLFQAEILVDDAHAAELGHGDGQAGFGDGIHGCGQDRKLQLQVASQPRFEVDVLGQDGRMGGDERDVVVSECFSLDAQHRHTRDVGKRDILPCFRAVWQGVDATQCRAGGGWFRGRPGWVPTLVGTHGTAMDMEPPRNRLW